MVHGTAFALKNVLEGLVLPRGAPLSRRELNRLVISDDGLGASLSLREGVWFHPHPCLPNGEPRRATAEDVVYSLEAAIAERLVQLPLRPRTEDAPLPAIRAVDARTTVLELNRQAPFLTWSLSEVPLLPRELQTGCDDPRAFRQPVGTGAFRFEGPIEGDSVPLRLVRFERFSAPARDGEGNVSAIEFQRIIDAELALSRLAHGELDLVLLQGSDSKKVLSHDDSGHPRIALSGTEQISVAPLIAPEMLTVVGLRFAHRPESPWAQPSLRRALALAFDRRALAQDPGMRTIQMKPTGRLLEPEMLGFDPLLPEFSFDQKAARALLMARGAPVPPLLVGCWSGAALCAELSRQLEAVGVPVTTVQLTAQNFQELTASGKLDAVLSGSTYETLVDEAWPLLPRFGALLKVNDGFSSKLASLETEGRRDLRARLYAELERDLLESLPWIPLARTERTTPFAFLPYLLVGPRVEGLIDPVSGRVEMSDTGFASVSLRR